MLDVASHAHDAQRDFGRGGGPSPTITGAVHRNGPHSIASVPRWLSAATMEIVKRSAGASSVSVCIGALARSLAPLYSVPHWPNCLLMIRSVPFARGTVQRV